jgi:hypothetical protein
MQYLQAFGARARARRDQASHARHDNGKQRAQGPPCDFF